MSGLPTYVLVTPARNEAELIELTLASVVAQTVRPLKWVIVSDGSTDGTDDIVRKYTAEHPWIELVQMPERKERNFAGKVLAFNAGQARMVGLEYDAICNLDADISFDPEYFSFLLGKLAGDPKLGLIGTAFKEGEAPPYDYRFVNIEHVTGTVQMFRRECFEQIGGYTPVKGGGIDYIAVVSSRMKGWKTRTFTEKVCQHGRFMGTAGTTQAGARYKYGKKDYNLGNHPLWQLSRVLYQMTKPPYFVGGFLLGWGYLVAAVQGKPRPVSAELVDFVRREQMLRLRNQFASRVPGLRETSQS